LTVTQLTGAGAAIAHVLQLLVEAGISATRVAETFYPQPVGVLVGLPTLEGRTFAGATYTVPILVVSGDPLGNELTVDRVYALADDCARAVRCDTYRPSSYQTSANAEPLPAVELAARLTLIETIEEA
jgi:hypothetical protein